MSNYNRYSILNQTSETDDSRIFYAQPNLIEPNPTQRFQPGELHAIGQSILYENSPQVTPEQLISQAIRESLPTSGHDADEESLPELIDDSGSSNPRIAVVDDRSNGERTNPSSRNRDDQRHHQPRLGQPILNTLRDSVHNILQFNNQRTRTAINSPSHDIPLPPIPPLPHHCDSPPVIPCNIIPLPTEGTSSTNQDSTKQQIDQLIN